MNEKKQYSLFLINPFQKHKHFATQIEMGRLLGKKNVMSPLALPLLAVMTPGNYTVRIIDEETEDIPRNEKPDLVGITTLSITIGRAYEIAASFRKQEIPVIMGGPYATYMPDEILQHADSVVIGEAEELWGKCLEDFEAGSLKKIYSSDIKPAYKKSLIPRWDLVNTKDILTIGVQVSRGCPYHCEFCLVTQMFGNKMRYREIDNVVEEIRSLPLKKILFVDDNLTFNKKYALELVKQLRSLNITWTCQSSIEIGFEENLLREMAESGCQNIIIGLESLNESSIKEIHKFHNRIEEYRQSIENILKAGIQVYPSFVVGFDHDTLEEFDKIVRFSGDCNLPYVMVSLLGASPGSELYDRANKDGRWYGSPTEFRGGIFPVMYYRNFTQVEVYRKYIMTLQGLYSFKNLSERATTLYSKGYFNRQNSSDDTGFFFKVKVSSQILKWYLFSSDKYKRKLFITLFRLFRGKQLAVDKMIIFLLSMEGITRHIKKIADGSDEFIEMFAHYDELRSKQSDI